MNKESHPSFGVMWGGGGGGGHNLAVGMASDFDLSDHGQEYRQVNLITI